MAGQAPPPGPPPNAMPVGGHPNNPTIAAMPIIRPGMGPPGMPMPQPPRMPPPNFQHPPGIGPGPIPGGPIPGGPPLPVRPYM